MSLPPPGAPGSWQGFEEACVQLLLCEAKQPSKLLRGKLCANPGGLGAAR